jgi:shikimate dehydrogenase
MKHFGLIGHPLGHSLSPQIHSVIMQEIGLDGEYKLYDIAPENMAKEIPELLKKLDGFNCTIPHKNAIVPFLDCVSDSAKFCTCVNTVYKGVGYNTDILGFGSYGIAFSGKRVLVLGSGGTCRMMLAAALAGGAIEVVVAARNGATAKEMISAVVEAVGGSVAEIAMPKYCGELPPDGFEADVILNGTPVGMFPHPHAIPAGVEKLLRPGVVVFDPIYNPLPSNLLVKAEECGAEAHAGLKMLVRQAIEAQRIWNPELAIDVEKVEAKVLAQIKAAQSNVFGRHIVLTGFMGSGKSSVGKELASMLGLRFVDLDVEIEAREGRSIPEIFAAEGEDGFRTIETAIAREVLASSELAVVATGGGFPIQESNRRLVRDCSQAMVVYLDVALDEAARRVAGDAHRPLAQDKARFEALYSERKPIYEAFADFTITTSLNNSSTDIAKALALLVDK